MTFPLRRATAAVATCIALGCGLAPASAGAAPAPHVDKTIPKESLSAPTALLDGRPADLADAVAYCDSELGACSFTVDAERTYRYYSAAHVLSERYINCTRATVRRTAGFTVREDAFDSVSQARKGLFPHPTLIRPDASGAMARQFEKALAHSSGAWTWTKATTGSAPQTVEPGETGWLEGQSARERVYGSFRAVGASAPAWRIDVIVDGPDDSVAARVFQRTGTLSGAELERCRSQQHPSPATSEDAGES